MTLSEQVLFCSLRREESVFPIPVTSCFIPCGEQVSANISVKGSPDGKYSKLCRQPQLESLDLVVGHSMNSLDNAEMNVCTCVSIKLLFTNPGKGLTDHRLLTAVSDNQKLKSFSSKEIIKNTQTRKRQPADRIKYLQIL